jgi:DNA-binding response OmpR family regulator
MQIDREKALRELGIPENIYESLLKVFIDETKPALRSLADSIAAAKLDDAARFAHFIKGSAGNLRLERIYSLAKEIEAGAREHQDVARLHELCEQLKTAFLEFREDGGSAGPVKKDKTVLVIDDAIEVTTILKFHLGKKYNVCEARDGEAGLRMIQESKPDLVILDINLPKLGGIALYNKISAGKGKPDIPVVVLTVREELGSLFRDLNVAGFITKPFEIEAVLKEVDTILAGSPEPSGEGPAAAVSRKVLIVENDAASFNREVLAFLNAGYAVESAKSGMEAIEKIMLSVPDIILIKLGLSDISGDLVCAKLRQMPKTMGTPLLLYAAKGEKFDRAVVARICEIAGIKLIESDDPAVLLEQAQKAGKAG